MTNLRDVADPNEIGPVGIELAFDMILLATHLALILALRIRAEAEEFHLARAGSEQGRERMPAEEGPEHGPAPQRREGRKAASRNPFSRALLRPVIDNNRNLLLKPALLA